MATTYQYEESLPHLPVPGLNQTIQQLLAAIKPLFVQEEYSQLLEDASEFVGNKLVNIIQRHLIAAANNPNHSCYLNSINDEVNPGIYGELNNDILPRNPYLVLEEDPYSQTINPPNQAERSASLTNSTLKFIIALRTHTLPPDITPKNKNPLTMYCYKNLFATTRIPCENHVTIRKYEKQKHIVIICNNQYYMLEVLTDNNRIWFNDHELSVVFQQIIDASENINPIDTVNNSIGSLTTQNFNIWKIARAELETSNKELLETIDSALFVLVLDVLNAPETDQEKTSVISHGSSVLLPGTSIQIGSCTSRWHDKLQLIVTKNSVAGVVWESASMDSTAILRYISDIYTDSILKLAKNIHGSEYTLFKSTHLEFVSPSEPEPKPEPKYLEVIKTPELTQLIHLSETRLADLINQHEYKTMTVKLDSHLVSKFKLPLDSVLQMCFQIANYTLYGKMVNTLEPITTRKFRDARTELVPIQNDAVYNLCKTFLSNEDSNVKWESFKKCCLEHSAKYLDAMSGKGFERHFLSIMHVFRSPEAISYLNTLNKDVTGLPQIPNIHEDAEVVIPPLLANPMIDKLHSPELLISNCGNPALKLFGITPAIDQGFGIGYIIHSDRTIITVSSKHRQTERFLNTFKQVVNELKDILQKESNLLFHSADTEIRRQELLKLQENKDSMNEKRGKAIPLAVLNNPIPYHRDSVSSDDADSPTSSDKKNDFDVFGGYGYFDFGDLDQRSDLLQLQDSYMNSEISISLGNGHSTPGSLLHSRHHSSTNLSKFTARIDEDMKTKMSLSDSIRERLQQQNESSTDLIDQPSSKNSQRSRNQIGRELDMSHFK